MFALQAESSRMKKEELEVEQVVHHKLPAYVANMDRLGDSELWVPAGEELGRGSATFTGLGVSFPCLLPRESMQKDIQAEILVT